MKIAAVEEELSVADRDVGEQGLLRRIDGTRPATDVHDHIRAVIATLRLEEDV